MRLNGVRRANLKIAPVSYHKNFLANQIARALAFAYRKQMYAKLNNKVIFTYARTKSVSQCVTFAHDHLISFRVYLSHKKPTQEYLYMKNTNVKFAYLYAGNG